MKKSRYYLFAFLLLTAGCQRTDEPFLSVEESASVVPETVITAVLEGNGDTRTVLTGPEDGIYLPVWSAGDKVAVYADGFNHSETFTLFEGAGTGKASFKGSLSGDTLVGLYPASDRTEEGLDGPVLTLDLPAEQIYAPDSFGEGSFPMLAVGTSGVLSFRNLCSVLKISLTGETSVHRIRFIANDRNRPVCGKATVRTDSGNDPELVMCEGGSPEVKLTCGVELDKTKPTDFFLVLPPGRYPGGFSLEIKTSGGTVTRGISSDIRFARSQVRSIPAFECVGNGDVDPDEIPSNEIWYVSTLGKAPYPMDGYFDRRVLSNTYSDGKGVIVLDGPVTQVKRNAFYGYFSEVILPNTVTTIDKYAFGYTPIRSFRTPEHLESVADEAFLSCDLLTRFYGPHASSDERGIVLGDGTLVAYAFSTLDETLRVPDGVRSLWPNFFANRSVLRHVILPEGLVSLGDMCFSGCVNLETVSVPESLETLGRNVFSDCPSLRAFEGSNAMIPDGRAIVATDGRLAAWAGAGVRDYVLPGNVTSFNVDIFRDRKCLHSLSFSTVNITRYATDEWFPGCDSLEYFYGRGSTADHHCLVLRSSAMLLAVTKILPPVYAVPDGYGIKYLDGPAVFSGNASVEHLSIPEGVLYIGWSTFSNMSRLKTLRLPSTVKSISSLCFSGTRLDTLYMKSVIPPDFYGEFDEGLAHDGLVIFVPKGSEDRYKTATNWSRLAGYIQGYSYEDLDGSGYYVSTDYSRDGEVTTLQTASEGRGIDIVLMGDGFSDRQIADGTYASVMNRMAEAFFSEEPYKSFRKLFNVRAVTVVSRGEGYDHSGQALGGWFGEGTAVGGDDAACREYALKAVSSDRMDNTVIIVGMNDGRYAGTCYLYPTPGGDYGCGHAIAYCPVGMADDQMARVLCHEAGGHGFAKLADEYAYAYNGAIPQSVTDTRRDAFQYGWWKNADFTGDPTLVKWKHLLSDARYQYDGLGCYEGAFTYWTGAWRPTDHSIMRGDTDGFNAPSREAIWYRMHKLAYGEAWNYDYEAFVAYDAINRRTAATTSSVRPSKVERTWTPTAPPVVVGRRWDEARK